MNATPLYCPWEFALDDAELAKLGSLFLTWSHIEHIIGNCLKAAMKISDDEAIDQVHDIPFEQRMIKLRKLRPTMNVDAIAAFDQFDAAFEYLQVLRSLVAHCILVNDADEGPLFHIRSKDRTLPKADIFGSENFSNYCAMVAMSLRYALGIAGSLDRRRTLPQTVNPPYALLHYMTVVEVKRPAQCSQTEIDSFRTFVLRGGEVQAQGLNGRISDAHSLAFLRMKEKKLAGIAALKNPNPAYKLTVFEKANYADHQFFDLELGWLFIAEQHRGKRYSEKLLKELLPSADGRGVYATSATDNGRMHHSMVKAGFVQVGSKWPSVNRENTDLLLFVRDGASG